MAAHGRLPNLHGWPGLALPMRDSSLPRLCAIQSTNTVRNCDAAEQTDLPQGGRVDNDLNSSILNLIEQNATGTLAEVGPR